MREDQPPSRTGWLGMDIRWWVLSVVGAGTFMSALDGSIVVTALPVIGNTTRTTFSSLEWVMLIYQLVVSSSLLVFGRLADIHGQKQFYIGGMSIFVLGSVLCGISHGIGSLIAFRGLQAIGAAMLFALGPAILTNAFPGEQRGRALGIQATVTYLGLAVGPALGGYITEHFGWPWIFFINLPIGMMVIIAAFRTITSDHVATRREPFDAAGAIVFAGMLTTLLFGLSKGHDYGWTSPVIIRCLVASVVLLIAFIVIENRIQHPLLDLKLFANKIFAASTAAAFLNYMASTSVTFLMPFYLINANRYSPADAGLILISTPVVMASVAGFAGWLSDKIGYRIPTLVGQSITVAGLLLLRTLKVGSSPAQIVPILAFIGLGIGLFTSPNNSAIMGSAPANRRGVAGALLAASRNLGFAMGTAVAGLIYASSLHTLTASQPQAQAITRSVQAATSIIALVALTGVVVSALRPSQQRTTDL